MAPIPVEAYQCPYSGEALSLDGETLVSQSGLRYPVVDGIPHLVQADQETYSPEEARENRYYEETAASYDSALDWLFRSFYADETTIRLKMVDLLELEPRHRVLETGAGTCRDTVEIAKQLDPTGEIYALDLSPRMLAVGLERLRQRLDSPHCRLELLVGNAGRLPFRDDFFDAAYHFGGLNLFTGKRQALSEMARVVRPGGKVVVGDEGISPWLRESEYGAILMNSNSLYRHRAPVELIPECARDAGVRWLIGGAFYVIDFRVGSGPPKVDLDLPIHGRRGGTHRTRYFGRLEGVTPEAKAIAEEAAAASGLSLHEWLDRAVRAAAAQAGPQEELREINEAIVADLSRTGRTT
jgi:ubiquinone/menaquinone biosynthesis C-methylase UbiE